MHITTKEVRNNILNNKESLKDENDVTTDTKNESEPDFDDPDDDTFNLILSTDYNTTDNNTNVD